MPINCTAVDRERGVGGAMWGIRELPGSLPHAPTRAGRTTTGWLRRELHRDVGAHRVPFAGLWLGREIYQYRPVDGITMMGGFMSWLWVIQAFLSAVLFLTGNYYLWIGHGPHSGRSGFQALHQVLLDRALLGAIVWGTPHTMIAIRRSLAAMGGSTTVWRPGCHERQDTAVN